MAHQDVVVVTVRGMLMPSTRVEGPFCVAQHASDQNKAARHLPCSMARLATRMGLVELVQRWFANQFPVRRPRALR